ncbi:MAG: hypothetical protein ACTS3R_16645 [Inquilinaceae bacterium]
MTKSILTGASAMALLIGLGLAPAYANPSVSGDDAYAYVDLTTGDFDDNDDVYIESDNYAALASNDLTAYVTDIYNEEYFDTGDLNSADFQDTAAGAFAQVINTGPQNAQNAANSIAANADINF